MKQQVGTSVLFSAALTHTVDTPIGHVLVFDKTLVNVGGAYSNSTGSFVCPEPGFYHFTINALTAYDKQFALALYKNDQDVVHLHMPAGQGHQGSSQTTVLKLVKGDVVQVRAYTTTTVYGTPADLHTTFTGLRVAGA